MSVKNPTQWIAPSGTGYTTAKGGLSITTLSSSQLTTLAGSSFVTDTGIYTTKADTSWSVTGKSSTSWNPLLGGGFTVTVGTKLFTDNLGDFLITNSGNNLVTTTTYDVPKYATAWTATGV